MLGTRSFRPLTLLAASALAVGVTATAGAAARPSAGTGRAAAHLDAGQAGCTLGAGGKIQHVIYMMFDNVHYSRDNPNVPSDLQQMPNLRDFLTGNGTLITHEHTPLIAHTADDIVTSESGLYGADQGMPIANEYNYYQPDGTTDTAGSFAYWTDPIVDYDTGLARKPVGDHTTTMIGTERQDAAGPVGRLHPRGLQLRHGRRGRTPSWRTPSPTCHTCSGRTRPRPRRRRTRTCRTRRGGLHGPGRALRLGSRVCAAGSGPDVLPDEPGGYHGLPRALRPQVRRAGDLRGAPVDLDGHVISDSNGDIGFPGFDGPTGVHSLAYIAGMQAHGVPVTFAYLSDPHDDFNRRPVRSRRGFFIGWASR